MSPETVSDVGIDISSELTSLGEVLLFMIDHYSTISHKRVGQLGSMSFSITRVNHLPKI